MNPLITSTKLTKVERCFMYAVHGMAKAVISLRVEPKTSASPFEPPLVWNVRPEHEGEASDMLKSIANDIHSTFEPHETRDRFIRIFKEHDDKKLK